MSRRTFVFIFVAAYLMEADAVTLSQIVITGSDVMFACNSSFPPAWSKFNPNIGEYKILAMSGKKHPNFKDDRIKFSSIQSLHQLKIKSVKVSDVGNYVCDGEKTTSFSLNVMR